MQIKLYNILVMNNLQVGMHQYYLFLQSFYVHILRTDQYSYQIRKFNIDTFINHNSHSKLIPPIPIGKTMPKNHALYLNTMSLSSILMRNGS